MPDIRGRPAAGFAVERIAARPATVEVVGPQSRLDRFAEASTEPVSIEGASDSVRATVTVGVADPMLRLRSPGSTQVTVEIAPAPAERTLHRVPVQATGGALAAEIRPDAVAVGVRGPRDALEDADVEAFVDLAGVPPGRHVLPVTVVAGPGAGVTHIDPSRVTVLVAPPTDP